MTTQRCQHRYAAQADGEQCRLWHGHRRLCRFKGQILSMGQAFDEQAAERAGVDLDVLTDFPATGPVSGWFRSIGVHQCANGLHGTTPMEAGSPIFCDPSSGAIFCACHAPTGEKPIAAREPVIFVSKRPEEPGRKYTIGDVPELLDRIRRLEAEKSAKPGTYLHKGVAYCSHCGSAAHSAEACTYSGTPTDWRAMYEKGQDERDRLGASVAELEAQHQTDLATIRHIQENSPYKELYERAEEGERRKNEECVRLEAQCTDLQWSVEHLNGRFRGCDQIIGEQRREIEQLRREQGKGRPR